MCRSSFFAVLLLGVALADGSLAQSPMNLGDAQTAAPQPQRPPHGTLDVSFGIAGRGSSVGATDKSPTNFLRRLLQPNRFARQQNSSPAVPPRSDVSIVLGIVDFDSSPEGAIAQTSLGEGCETPCSMEI